MKARFSKREMRFARLALSEFDARTESGVGLGRWWVKGWSLNSPREYRREAEVWPLGGARFQVPVFYAAGFYFSMGTDPFYDQYSFDLAQGLMLDPWERNTSIVALSRHDPVVEGFLRKLEEAPYPVDVKIGHEALVFVQVSWPRATQFYEGRPLFWPEKFAFVLGDLYKSRPIFERGSLKIFDASTRVENQGTEVWASTWPYWAVGAYNRMSLDDSLEALRDLMVSLNGDLWRTNTCGISFADLPLPEIGGEEELTVWDLFETVSGHTYLPLAVPGCGAVIKEKRDDEGRERAPQFASLASRFWLARSFGEGLVVEIDGEAIEIETSSDKLLIECIG